MMSSREVIGLAVSVLDAVDPFDLTRTFDLPASMDALVAGTAGVSASSLPPRSGVHPALSEQAERDHLAAEVLPLMAALERHLERISSRRPGATPAPRAQEHSAGSPLTARESEALVLLSHGLTAAAAARRMGCSLSTANKHFGNVYRKLGVGDRLAAVLEAQRRGILPADSSGQQERTAAETRGRPQWLPARMPMHAQPA